MNGELHDQAEDTITAFVAAAERGRQACREGIDACQAAIAQINADRVARGVAPLEF
jgi:hypothetical protein